MAKPDKPPRALKTSLFARDPTRRTHFIHSAHLGTASRRFEAFQNWLLSEGHQTLDQSSLVLGCLLSFDGLATDNDLRGAYAACTRAARWNNGLRIDWLDGPRINARDVSVLTTLALQRVAQWPPFETAQSVLMQHVLCTPLGDAFAKSSVPTWDQLRQDGMAWLQSTLPPIFYGHVSEAERMSALPRTALAREEQKLALKIEAPDSPQDANSNDTAYARAFEAAMLGRPPSTLSGGQFLKKLTDALRPPVKGSIATKRSEILQALRLLAAEIDHVDEVSALLYLFALDLVENGTRRKSKLAPTTPYDYVQSFAMDFHAEASGLHLAGIEPKPYSQIYSKLLNATNTASYRVAGLKAFHLFLRSWWTVPRLPLGVFGLEIDTPVAANMIWPHERKLLNQWLGEVEPTRFTQQLGTGFAITGHAMVRISELMVLRLMNVIDEGDHLCIEIARKVSDGKEKSSEGRRRVFIKDAEAVAQIRAWRARRVEENASLSDYLFGDPSDPKKLADAGKMYFWMNRLLKTVTGDDSLSVHIQRHSIASHRFVSISLDDRDYEINPIDELANEAGHAGGHVTTVNYCHLFEVGLRWSLDKGLHHLDLDYAAVSAWTQIPATTLRKRVSRSEAGSAARSEILWGSLKEAAEKLQQPAISQSCAVVVPDNPLLALKPKALGYPQVVGLLSDIARGLSIAQTSLRQDVKETIVVEAIKLVGAFADRHGAPEPELGDQLTLGSKALRDGSGGLLGMRPDFFRMAQARWTQLPSAFERGDPWLLAESTDYWQRTLCNEHVAVKPGPGWDKFVELLKEASINTSLMALKWSINPASEADVLATLALAQATVRVKLGSSVKQIQQAPRAGRPSIWLVIGSDAKLLSVDGSGSSMTGLHCALISAHVWLKLTEKLNRENYE